MRKTIYVTTQFVGFHQWKDAPQKVAFLRDMHRHIFHVKAQVEVSHSDRDVEFFLLKEDLEFLISRFEYADYLGGRYIQSCEWAAEELIKGLTLSGYTVTSVEVNEDNENGAVIYNSI